MPTSWGKRTVVNGFAHQLDSEAMTAILGKNVDVAKVCNVHVVGEHPREADLAAVMVEADHTRRPSSS